MASLYRNGWRQGSVFSADLTCAITNVDGTLQIQRFSEWIVVTQECDLDGAESSSSEPLLELRPIYPNQGGHAVGIRSGVFVLDAKRVVCAQSPRAMISPRSLSALCSSPTERLSARRATLFKMWLGLRYDRPAVPDRFVPLAKAVAHSVKLHKGAVADLILDVLMTFADGHPPVVALYAVTEDDTHRNRVEDWLENVSAEIPPETGIVKAAQLATVRQISLWTLQNSYSADVTQLSITKADKREI